MRDVEDVAGQGDLRAFGIQNGFQLLGDGGEVEQFFILFLPFKVGPREVRQRGDPVDREIGERGLLEFHAGEWLPFRGGKDEP